MRLLASALRRVLLIDYLIELQAAGAFALADLFGISWAIGVIGGVTFLSGVVVSGVMRETLPSHRKAPGAPP